MTQSRFNFLGFSICGIAALFYAYEYVLGILPSLMMHKYMLIFHATAAQVGFLTSLYYYPFVGMLLFAGPIIDRLPSRYIITINCALCALTIYTLSIATTLVWADVSRAVMGVGSAFAYVSMFFLIEQWLNKKWFTFYISIYSSFGEFAFVICNLWFIMLLYTHTIPSLEEGLAWFGFALAIVALLIVRNKFKPQQEQGEFNFKEFMHQSKTLLNAWDFKVVLGLSIIYSVGWSVFAASWGLVFLQDAYKIGRSNAAIINACLFAGGAIGTIFFGLLANLIKKRRLQLIICSITYLTVQLVIIYASNLHFITLAILYCIMGVVTGCDINLYYIAERVTPKSLNATAMALVDMTSLIPYLLLPPLVGYILDTHWTGSTAQGVHIFSPHAFKIAFSILPVCTLFAIILSFMLKHVQNPGDNASLS